MECGDRTSPWQEPRKIRSKAWHALKGKHREAMKQDEGGKIPRLAVASSVKHGQHMVTPLIGLVIRQVDGNPLTLAGL